MPGPKIRCKVCGDVIQSMYRHDFVYCRCRKIAVDGGGDYLKFMGDRTNAEQEDGSLLFADIPTASPMVDAVNTVPFWNAVTRARTAQERLASFHGPRYPKAVDRATTAILDAVRELEYALACLEQGEQLEKED